MDIGVGLSRTVADDALRCDVYTQATWFTSEFACLYLIFATLYSHVLASFNVRLGSKKA